MLDQGIKCLLNSTHDAMVAIDLTEKIVLFNHAAELIIGCTAEEALGEHVSKIINNTRLPFILETGKPELNRQQNLGDITIITNRVPVFNDQRKLIGAAAVFRDISDIKNLGEKITDLQHVKSLLEAIINCTQDAISVVDEKGFGLLINPAYTKITGLKAEEVINKPATVDIAEGESMHLHVLRTQQPVKDVMMKVGPARKEVIVDVSPIIVDGELKGSVGVIHDISEIKKLSQELNKAKRTIRRLEAKYHFEDIICASKKFQFVIEQAKRAAPTSATVLIQGESGTGKEMFAHAIHNASNRNRITGQFVRVNCAALNENLLESELFGYVEGAFSGAKRGGKVGLFEEADGGTIFLDEIGEISLKLQTKLLRVLQEKELLRVGDTKPRPIDVRVIAATNANLDELIAQKKFRQDLFYRLNVIPIVIPPLRERTEDFYDLALHLVQKLNQEYGRNLIDLSGEAIKYLQNYEWPGNVRELENVLGRAVINMRHFETIIDVNHLPLLNSYCTLNSGIAVKGKLGTYEENFSKWEQNFLEAILKECNYNKTEAARRLNISIRSLYYKLEKYNLK